MRIPILAGFRKVTHTYLRGGTNEQELAHQADINTAHGWAPCIASALCGKESGTHTDRPELLRIITDLQAS
ncbi:MAG: hypothetical protein ABI351_14385 [Herbaspirillum sp.]